MAVNLETARELVQPGEGEDRIRRWAEAGNGNLLGVVGGLGPLASAEFLKTIYEHSLDEREQEASRVVLYSDPTFLDRTEAFLNGAAGQLLNQLVEALTRLRGMGASHLVICCVTIHHLLPRLPSELRERVLSLVDVVFDEVAASHESHLLLCTSGTRQLRIFESHDLWQHTGGRFVLPDAGDQQEIHRLIYRIKESQDPRQQIPVVESLLVKYHVNSFIAGCTEIHLFAKHFAAGHAGGHARRCIDPLMLIAREWANAPKLRSLVEMSTLQERRST